MNVALALLALAAPPVVAVPAGGSPDVCVARARLARAVALSPQLRLVRPEGAPVGADLVLDAAPSEDGMAVTARAGQTRSRATGELGAALKAVWPKALPPPAAVARASGASLEALTAACANDAAAAYAAAGDAISPVVSGLVPPPDSLRRGTLLQRWAWARHQRQTERGCRSAQATLREVVATLERGYLPPTWRRPPRDARRPSAITRVPGAWVLFEDGRFFAVDPDSGAPLWTRRAARAEPRPVSIGEGRIALAHAEGLTVLETSTGTAAWQAALPAPLAEISASRGKAYVSAGNEVVALDARTGEIRWRFDGLSRPSAGPAVVRGELVVPLYSRVEVLDPETGQSLRKIELGDEITAPLLPTDEGIWVAVGAEELALVDVRSATVRHRTKEIFGAEWPPAQVAGQAFVVTRPPRGLPALTLVDPDRARPRQVRIRGLGAPVLGLADFSGVVHPLSRPHAIVARDIAGKERWRARQAGAVRALSAPGDLVVAGVGRRVVVLDRKRGRPLWQTRLESEVIDVRYDQGGGVVALANGALYGLPGGRDPRIPARLRQARLDLADCQADLRAFSSAEAVVKKVLARAPTDPQAWLRIARLRAARKQPDALAAWLAAHAATRAVDPARAEILEALEALAGVTAVARPRETPDRLEALEGAALTVRRGTRTEHLDPVTGAPRPAPEGVRVRFDGRARTLTRTDGGQQTWRLDIDDPALAQAFAADTLIVLTSTDAQGRALVVDAGAGARRWMRPLETAVRRAWPSTGAILVQTEGGALWGLDAQTGARRFRKPAPAEGFAVHTLAEGWLIVEGNRLSRLDERGRRRFAVRLPGDVRGSKVGAGHVLYWTKDSLVALELERGRRAGRLTELEVKDLVLDDTLAVALLEDGRLLTFDPRRGLTR